jgi:hypothetical protein
MMLTARPPHRMQRNRQRLTIEGNGALSSTPTASKVTEPDCKHPACLHVSRKAVTPMDFR